MSKRAAPAILIDDDKDDDVDAQEDASGQMKQEHTATKEEEPHHAMMKRRAPGASGPDPKQKRASASAAPVVRPPPSGFDGPAGPDDEAVDDTYEDDADDRQTEATEQPGPLPAVKPLQWTRQMALQSSGSPVDGFVSFQNAQYMTMVDEALQEILAHPIFVGVKREEALTVEAGSNMQPFSVETVTAQLRRAGSSKVGGNLFWLDMRLESTASSTPVRAGSVIKTAMEFYNEPKAVLGDVEVAVNSRWADPAQAPRVVMEDRPYRVVSPVEKLHAIVFAVQRDIAEGHVQKLQEWKKILLSTSMVFRIQENDEALRWQALNLRERPGIEYDLVRHGALQRIIEIRDFVSKRPELNGSNRAMSKTIAAEYNGKLKLSDFSEKLSDTMVFQCLEVYDRVLMRSPTILSMLHEMDGELGTKNPFDKVARLFALSGKCSGAIGQAEWLFAYLKDLFEGGKMGFDDFGKRLLAGADSKQKGLADLILLKKTALSRLLSWASSRIREDELKVLHSMTSTVADFRAAVGRVWSRTAPLKVATPWRAGWSRGGDGLLTFIENFIFGTQYDEVCQTWMQRRKPLDELFEMEAIADEMASIEASAKEEQATTEEAKPVVLAGVEPESEAVSADELGTALSRTRTWQKFSRT